MISEINYEKFLLINNRQLKYKGIFRADELFSTVNRALEERGYTKREKKSEEIVTEAGKKTYLELRPYKELTRYLALMIKIKVNLDNVTETPEEVRGERRMFQQGDILIAFDAWLMTDYKNRWGMKPFFFFLKGMMNKYLYKTPIEANAFGELAGDTAYIYARIKKLLSSYRKEPGAVVKEEEIVKQIEKELKEEIEKETRLTRNLPS